MIVTETKKYILQAKKYFHTLEACYEQRHTDVSKLSDLTSQF